MLYYIDKALMLGKGVTQFQKALAFKFQAM